MDENEDEQMIEMLQTVMGGDLPFFPERRSGPNGSEIVWHRFAAWDAPETMTVQNHDRCACGVRFRDVALPQRLRSKVSVWCADARPAQEEAERLDEALAAAVASRAAFNSRRNTVRAGRS